jgi:hypothetical protein
VQPAFARRRLGRELAELRRERPRLGGGARAGQGAEVGRARGALARLGLGLGLGLGGRPRRALRGRRRLARGVRALDQEPLLAVPLARAAHAHERPAPAQPLAGELEVELAPGEAALRVALGLPGAAVPDLDRAGAVLAGRDAALEAPVLERVVLDVHRQALLAHFHGRALRHRPRHEHTAQLEPEVVVQAARGVLLHDEAQGRALLPAPALGLGRQLEVALAPVGVERHGGLRAVSGS